MSLIMQPNGPNHHLMSHPHHQDTSSPQPRASERRCRPRMTTKYVQYELIYSDGQTRISPIFIKPVDKETFNPSAEPESGEKTWYRVERSYFVTSDLYKYSPKTVEEITNQDCKNIQPIIKQEIKFKLECDVKPKTENKNAFIDKTFVKVEPKREPKKEVSTELKSGEQSCLNSTPIKCRETAVFEDSAEPSPSKRKSGTIDINDTIEVQPTPRKRRQSTESSYECYFQSKGDDSQDIFCSPHTSDDECADDFESANAPDSDDDIFIESHASPSPSSDTVSSLSTSTDTVEYDANEILRTQLFRQSVTRFDDHLRKEIFWKVISMLSMKEKLKLESVSKEWQSITRQQQKILVIFLKKSSDSLTFDWDTVSFRSIQVMNSFGVQLIEKFPNLTHIEVLCPAKSRRNISPIVEAINDCNLSKLDKVMFRGVISTDTLIRFALLFGDQLKSIDINSGDVNLTDDVLIAKRLYSDNLVSAAVHTRVDALTLYHLPSITEVTDLNIQNLDNLKLLARHYRDQITKISFRDEHYLWGNKDVNKALKILSRFKNLEYLEFYMVGVEGRAGPKHTLDAGFEPVQTNCTNLKELHLFGSDAWFPLTRIQTLTNLRVLGLFFDLNPGQSLDFNAITRLELTELWIYCDIRQEEMGDLLLQMPTVRILHIKSNMFYAIQVHDLIKLECGVTTLYVEDGNITELTVSAAIVKARNNPNVRFQLFAGDYESYRSISYQCSTLIRPDIPKNLKVVVKQDNPILSTSV